MKNCTYFLIGIFLVAFTSCQSTRPSLVFSPENLQGRKVEWSKEALAKTVAVQTLQTTPQASYHLVRLTGAEAPHIHETHDLAG